MNINNNTIVYPLPSDELITREEKAWRVKLPNGYSEFIKKYNGSIPLNNRFSFGDREYLIERFLCILDETENHDSGIYDIDVVLTQIEDRLTDNEDLVGVELLPFAVLFAGDFLCLDFRNESAHPCVSIWYHEESGELDPVTKKVADSIEDFFGLLS